MNIKRMSRIMLMAVAVNTSGVAFANNVTDWMSEHKKELAIGAAITTAAGVAIWNHFYGKKADTQTAKTKQTQDQAKKVAEQKVQARAKRQAANAAERRKQRRLNRRSRCRGGVCRIRR